MTTSKSYKTWKLQFEKVTVLFNHNQNAMFNLSLNKMMDLLKIYEAENTSHLSKILANLGIAL